MRYTTTQKINSTGADTSEEAKSLLKILWIVIKNIGGEIRLSSKDFVDLGSMDRFISVTEDIPTGDITITSK